MKLIAKVTIDPGNLAPGTEFDVKDADEAERLIRIGAAVEAPKSKPKPAAVPAEYEKKAGAPR